MMRKLLVLAILGVASISCDFATDSVALKPDLEITFVNPVANPAGGQVVIQEIDFTPMNSVDCTIDRLELEYWDLEADTRFVGPFEIPIYMYIPGRVHPEKADTFALENVPLETDTVLNYLIANDRYEAKALLSFIAYDNYDQEWADTVTCWFGLYRAP
jgi:hypothetical protein